MIDFPGEHQIVVALVHLLGNAPETVLRINVAVGDGLLASLVDFVEPHQRADNRAVAAGMLGVITGAPGDSAPLLAVLYRAVPSVYHIFGKILGLLKIGGCACEPVGLDEFPHEPHLVIIHIIYPGDIGGICRARPVDRIHAPVPGLGETYKSESSPVVVQS